MVAVANYVPLLKGTTSMSGEPILLPNNREVKVDITKAKKVIELSKDNRKILVTLYEGGQVSSCVTEEPPPTESLEFPTPGAKQYCETCQCDDETCQQWLEHLKEKGYQATEIELGELELEESLPKFLEQRELPITPEVVVEREEQVITSEDIGKVEDILGEPEREVTNE